MGIGQVCLIHSCAQSISMKTLPFGLLLILVGQVSAQNHFTDYVKTKDSLNVLNFRKHRDVGQFDKTGAKIGHWIEYKLLKDSADNLVPVTVKGVDFEVSLELPKPTTFQKSEGTYKRGIFDGMWQWFEADYTEKNEINWTLSRKTKFKNGKRNGPEIELGIFGEVLRKAEYSNDMLNGYEIRYWRPDLIASKVLWKADVVQKADVFYQSGQIKTTSKLQSNHLWTVTEYHENGKVKATYQESGEGKEGVYREYDEAGTLIITKVFKNGVEK